MLSDLSLRFKLESALKYRELVSLVTVSQQQACSHPSMAICLQNFLCKGQASFWQSREQKTALSHFAHFLNE